MIRIAKIFLIALGCNFHYSLLAFQGTVNLADLEEKIINSRGCQEVAMDQNSSPELIFFIRNRCNQKYSACDEVLTLNPETGIDSILYLLLLGDCNLFSPVQNTSVAYEKYLLAYESAKWLNSKVLIVESLNKLINYNLYALTVPQKTQELVTEHLSFAYDSLEQIRNQYFQLRLDYPVDKEEISWDKTKGINAWKELLSKLNSKHPKIESDMRSFFGGLLHDCGYSSEAEIEYLKSISIAERVNKDFWEGVKFSSFCNIGYLKLKKKETQLALNYFVQAQGNSSRMASDRNTSLLYSWIAETYKELGQVDSAYHYLNLSQEKAIQADQSEHATRIQEIQSKYDNEKLNNELLVEQGKKQRSNYFMVFFIGLSLISLLVYRNQKIKTTATEKELENAQLKSSLEKQQALEHERVRIAAEMHDDLGGGLTTIKFLSQKVLKNMDSEKDKSKVEKIVSHSQKLVGNMSEIIWAMNAGFDTLESLIAYTRRFASEYLEDHEIDLKFRTEGVVGKINISGEKRRSIFLVIKEAIHNVVKHANATEVELTFTVRDKIEIKIQDNGKGFEGEMNQLGNGLQNMKNRIQKIDGEIQYLTDKGVCVEIWLPVKKENNSIT